MECVCPDGGNMGLAQKTWNDVLALRGSQNPGDDRLYLYSAYHQFILRQRRMTLFALTNKSNDLLSNHAGYIEAFK